MSISGVVAARQTITRLQGVVKEAVHVKIYPRPRNLAESREVLRVLQQYGEIAMYKHLKVSSAFCFVLLCFAWAWALLCSWLGVSCSSSKLRRKEKK